MHFIGEDGTMKEVEMPLHDFLNLKEDDIQNLANPAFPIPSEWEVSEKNKITIAQTTQGYLDAINDVGIISSITPYVKDKIDKIIFDIGVHMFWKDPDVREK